MSNSFALTLSLPCGCTLQMTYRDDSEGLSPTHPRLLDFAARTLGYWTEIKLPRHRCALVSPDNPNGIFKGDSP